MTSKIVADARCSRAPMRGPMGLQVLVPYPPIPVLQLDAEQLAHPVMFRLASPMLPFVAPLEVGDPPEPLCVPPWKTRNPRPCKSDFLFLP